jgi:hypothetical protein
MKGRDRNKLCWCGSGKKFKRCHLDRDTQPMENPWVSAEKNRQAFSKKKCFALNSGLGDCGVQVIKAHTVSRGPNLVKIAKDGHVLQYEASYPEMNKNGGKLSLKKIGIRDASVFYGYCRKHDQELFSCIENEKFVGRADQCLAVAYRTISRELYGKDASAHLRETLRIADKGLKPFEQFRLQELLDGLNAGNEAARKEIGATYEALTNALVNVRPDALSSVVFEFEAALPFMFAGAWSPFTDLYGKVLQKGRLDELLEQIIISSFAGETRAMICISWRNMERAPGQIVAEQLMALPREKLASACIQFALKHIENVFFNPTWFQGLNPEQRERLDKLAADGTDLRGKVPSMPINPNLDFRLPCSASVFRV